MEFYLGYGVLSVGPFFMLLEGPIVFGTRSNLQVPPTLCSSVFFHLFKEGLPFRPLICGSRAVHSSSFPLWQPYGRVFLFKKGA